jgi:ABC-type multidrug transport system fused ATPase/permease subunit
MDENYRPGRAWRQKRPIRRPETAATIGSQLGGRRVAGRLAAFAKPHWKSVTFALAMLLGETLMTLAKPWPIKFALDNILTEPSLRGRVLDLLAGVMLLVVVSPSSLGFSLT